MALTPDSEVQQNARGPSIRGPQAEDSGSAGCKTTTSQDFLTVAVIIPALNEAESLKVLLPLLIAERAACPSELSVCRAIRPDKHRQRLVSVGRVIRPDKHRRSRVDDPTYAEFGQVLVCDNGSVDATREVVETLGAQWVYEPKRGYGAACFAGTQRLAPSIEIVVFMDADLSDDVTSLPKLVQPIVSDQCDLVLGARVPQQREAGSTTLLQRFANRLFPVLIRAGWGYDYTDLGPFRAIRRSSLEAIAMRDRAFGWTIEMQIRAVELGLRIQEIPVPYRRRRRGSSKISGTLGGVLRAGYWIIRTCAVLWLTKHRRMNRKCRTAN